MLNLNLQESSGQNFFFDLDSKSGGQKRKNDGLFNSPQLHLLKNRFQHNTDSFEHTSWSCSYSCVSDGNQRQPTKRKGPRKLKVESWGLCVCIVLNRKSVYEVNKNPFVPNS